MKIDLGVPCFKFHTNMNYVDEAYTGELKKLQ